MPKCSISVPCEKPSKIYFAIRFVVIIFFPANIFGNWGGMGQRNVGKRMMTSATLLPCKCGRIPRSVVSTSGSSGTVSSVFLIMSCKHTVCCCFSLAEKEE